MNYKIVNISKTGKQAVLIIYTGGTFGMVRDESGILVPLNFGKVLDKVPVLKYLDMKLTVISFPKPIDSSNIGVQGWKDLAYIVEENYSQYDGFVILHGTDTMAYSASVLSFMLTGLNKPVIFTGAQMPIGSLRSDARENLITALEIAGSYKDGVPKVSEVCVYFNHELLRGNRSQKVRSSAFAAFESENYPPLAKSGIEIAFNHAALRAYDHAAQLKVNTNLCSDIAILKLYPGISKQVITSIFNTPKLRGMVLESFGSGNTMNFKWFIDILKVHIEKGIVILNVSQCIGGEVRQRRYETSKPLNEIGVISGKDLTTEAAVAKLMFLLGNFDNVGRIKKELSESIAGEINSH